MTSLIRVVAFSLLVASVIAASSGRHFYALHPAEVPEEPWHIVKGGAVDLHLEVNMIVALQRRNMDLLEETLLEVSNPKSANYGEHLNDEQIRQMVSPGEKTLNSVKDWLKSAGVGGTANINTVELARHEDSIKFRATRAQLSTLLKVKWELYENSVTNQVAVRALGSDTMIPRHLAQAVEIIAGHRGLPLPPKKLVGGVNKRATDASTGPDVTPELLYRVYNVTDVPTTPPGKRNLQSFFQAGGQAVKASDLTTFCSTYMGGINSTCQIAKYVGDPDKSTPGIESSLDSQYIIATGMGTETWAYTYNSNDLCSSLLTWAQDVFAGEDGVHPNVISMSYGSQKLPMYCEGLGAFRMNGDTMKMGVAGISVLVASGDMGSGQYSREGYNGGYLAASFPAELPYVTSVGATTFTSGNSGTETAASFSGGGYSWRFANPVYQNAASYQFLISTPYKPTAHYNETGRGTPDVSALGMGYNVIVNGKVEVGSNGALVAGTSCSTPVFAGMITLLNNIRLRTGKTLGFLNLLFYQNTDVFTDILTGNNDMKNEDAGWHAQAGWDPVTGLGTPNFNRMVDLIESLNRPATPVPPTQSPPPPTMAPPPSPPTPMPPTAAPTPLPPTPPITPLPLPTHHPATPAPAAPTGCSAFTSEGCDKCLDTLPDCGWCNGACMVGNNAGPSSAGACDGHSWAYLPSQCAARLERAPGMRKLK